MLSIRRFALTRILFFVVPLVVLGSAFHWWHQKRLLEGLFDDSLQEKARTLATLVTTQDGKWELDFADEYIPQYSQAEKPYYFQIWLPDGRSLERSRSLWPDDSLPRTVGSLDRPETFWATLESGARVRCIGISFPIREATEPEVNPAYQVDVVVGADHALLSETMSVGLLEVVMMSSITVTGITLVVFLTLHRGATLLEKIVQQVHRIDPTSRARELDAAASPREIRPIVVALNLALDEIQTSVERDRRFSADVAHELRTPISELKTASDVAMKWRDPEAVEEAVVCASKVAERMATLVESLLALTRLESGQAELPTELVDLSEELRCQIRELGVESRLHCVMPQELRAEVNCGLWEIVAGNLVSNALEYSPPDSQVSVELREANGAVLFRVQNQTTGLSKSDLRFMCDRMWRKDRARADGGHSGLGLSIVRAACKRTGAELRFSLEGEELAVEVSLRQHQAHAGG